MDNVAVIRAVSGVLALGVLGLCLPIYFLPSLIARRKRNALGIFILNFVAGWTVIGWVAALIWSLDDSMPLIVNQQYVGPAVGPAILCSGCGKYSVRASLFCSNCGQPLGLSPDSQR